MAGHFGIYFAISYYFLTSDFRSFRRLTNLQPQNDYNWINSEIVTWKQFDGKTSQGILYKPENFDARKKYPVIFTYYMKVSDGAFEFPSVQFTYSSINIPWFVSRGYLVFMPDIHYTPGKVSERVCNSVLSAADCLSKKTYVDSDRIGINGHSFGGYETNILVTNSKLFAAAASGAGISNCVSHYGGLVGKFFSIHKRTYPVCRFSNEYR